MRRTAQVSFAQVFARVLRVSYHRRLSIFLTTLLIFVLSSMIYFYILSALIRCDVM